MTLLRGVPLGVPSVIRAGTGNGLLSNRRKSLQGASFGVQGSLVAPLLEPLPFRLPRPHARTISLGRDARSDSLSRKGKGCDPCTPARIGSPDATASDRWPLPTTALSIAISEWCNRRCLAVSHGTVLFVFPLFYEYCNSLFVSRETRILPRMSSLSVVRNRIGKQCGSTCSGNRRLEFLEFPGQADVFPMRYESLGCREVVQRNDGDNRGFRLDDRRICFPTSPMTHSTKAPAKPYELSPWFDVVVILMGIAGFINYMTH